MNWKERYFVITALDMSEDWTEENSEREGTKRPFIDTKSDGRVPVAWGDDVHEEGRFQKNWPDVDEQNPNYVGRADRVVLEGRCYWCGKKMSPLEKARRWVPYRADKGEAPKTSGYFSQPAHPRCWNAIKYWCRGFKNNPVHSDSDWEDASTQELNNRISQETTEKYRANQTNWIGHNWTEK